MRTLFLALALALAFAAASASGATSAGRSQAASSARNGEIAFSAHVQGIAQVFTVNPDGTGLRQVTHGTANAGDNGLSWSPDGRTLLYTLSGPDIDRIVKSGADGSAPTVISAPCTGTCLGDDDPVYSPDGTKIAFVRAYGPILASGDASDAGIFTMNADGSDLTQLTQTSVPTSSEDRSPQWSPDGTKIAFVRLNTTAQPSNVTAIMVMNADGSNVQQITPFRISAAHPHWSPDGKQLLFRNHEYGVQGQSGNLVTMRADGSHRVQLTHYSGGYQQGVPDAWSPDGTQILFRHLRFSGTDTQVGGFYVLNLRTKQIRRLTPVRIRYDTEAAWGRKPG
jgi:Tol biopolymer transport system component